MTIIPIKELKDTAAIAQKSRELDEPIHITKNGYGEMVIMSTKTFERYESALQQLMQQALIRQQDLQETVAAVKEGLADVAEGRTVDARDAIARIRQSHGL